MSKNKKKADEKATKIPVESPEEHPVENEEVKKLQEELEKKAFAHTGSTGDDKQLSFAHGFSSSFSVQRAANVSQVRADKITWSVSIRITDWVFRP